MAVKKMQNRNKTLHCTSSVNGAGVKE